MGRSLARRCAVAAVGALTGLSAVACSLIVGEVHGHLTGDASVTEDGSVAADASLGEDAPVVADAGVPEASESGALLDAGCVADFDADPNNCGWCGHACGTVCSGGGCTEQFVSPINANGLAYDRGMLFLTVINNNEVVAWNLGTAMSQTIAPSQNGPGHIAVHFPYVFWTTADGAIHRVLEDGGALTTVVPSATAYCLAANSRRLYWWTPTSGTAYSVPVDSDGGAMPVVEYMGSPGAAGCVIADDGELAVITSGVLLQRDLDSGLATTATLSNPADTQLVALAGPRAIALTTSTGTAGSTVHVDVVPRGTSTVLEVASFPSSTLFALTADDAGIYWSAQGDSRVNGCSDPLCASGIRHYNPSEPTFTIGNVALDPTYIYFTRGGSTAGVYKVPR